MTLHKNTKLFRELIRTTSEYYGINPVFIEKDYWITNILYNLHLSEYANKVVFKGGTSLTKAYKLINRFSEDVDLALLNSNEYTSNQIKTIIRNLEKHLTIDLKENNIDNISSKGSRFRKSVFEYPNAFDYLQSNRIILEINSFSNPYPFEILFMQSFITDYLLDSKNDKIIESYSLNNFYINVLHKNQTLVEKIASLIRFSFEVNYVESISTKIRHFYDIYYLMNDSECKSFIKSSEFFYAVNKTIEGDKTMFEIPAGWTEKELIDSPIISGFEKIWQSIKHKYKNELSALAFSEIPDEKEIYSKFVELIELLKPMN